MGRLGVLKILLITPILICGCSSFNGGFQDKPTFEEANDLFSQGSYKASLNMYEQIIEKYQPHEAAVEDLFFFKNVKTVMKVSQARGSILLTLEKNCVSIFEYTPLQVKQALTGYGRAEKKQIQLMVKNILKLKEIPKPDDTADAIAIALCHLNSRKMREIKNSCK